MHDSKIITILVVKFFYLLVSAQPRIPKMSGCSDYNLLWEVCGIDAGVGLAYVFFRANYCFVIWSSSSGCGSSGLVFRVMLRSSEGDDESKGKNESFRSKFT